jgi:alkylation response protein AidB-like acyl-CoA dehydrogenase
VDPLQIERDAKIPTTWSRAQGARLPGHEDPGGVRRPRPQQVYYNKALALVGTYHAALGTLLSAHQSIGLPEPLRMFGTEEQKREWLPKVARTHISAFLLTEPDVGSDPARMSATAIPTEDGTGYRITGTKLWATNGAIADVVIVMAVVPKTETGKGGITAFICPYDAEGITSRPATPSWACAGIENSLTRFEDVFVPNDAVVGGVGKGLRIALATLNTGRLSLPGHRAASAKYALKISREWAPSASSGASRRQHDPVAQSSRSWPARRSASRPSSTSRAAWPTTSATTSASRRRSPSSTAPRWAGRPSTR